MYIYELEGISFMIPVTSKTFFPILLLKISIFPTGSSSLKYLRAIRSVITTCPAWKDKSAGHLSTIQNQTNGKSQDQRMLSHSRADIIRHILPIARLDNTSHTV